MLFLSVEDGEFKRTKVDRVDYILSRPYGILLSPEEIQTIRDCIQVKSSSMTKEWLEKQKLVHQSLIQIIKTI